MKKLCMICLCLLLAACLLTDAALAEATAPEEAVVAPEAAVVAPEAEDVAPEEAVFPPEDAVVRAEAADAVVPEAEADLDAVDDVIDVPDDAVDAAEAAVPEEAIDLDAAQEGALPEAGDDPQVFTWSGAPLDNDALFAGYVDRLFGPEGDSLFEARYVGGDLTGAKKLIYDVLREGVAEVAAGRRASTMFTCPYDGSLSSDDIYDVVDHLIADCPYELYWHNNFCSINLSGCRVQVCLGVGKGYGEDYTIDTTKVSRAQAAAANARGIVDRYRGQSDYDRLVSYRDAICDMTSYNDAATYATWPAGETDPWQLIWVFDGDPATDVVCEGYARAFQYLCDMTDFSGSVMCYSVTGTLDGWGHKWNIVRMPDGMNYLVDLTQCDQEQTGTYDWTFMKPPTEGSVSEGYAFSVRNGDQVINCRYRYDEEALRVYRTSDLTLSLSGYDPNADLSGQGVVEYDLDALGTDGGQGGASSGAAAGEQVIAMRGNARATVSVGSVYRIDLGGSTGRRFKSSNRKVARVSSSGVVTPRKAGRAKITFKVGKKKRTLTLKVVDPTVPAWVSLTPSGTVAARKGERVALSAGIPEGTRSGFAWKSSNRRVATVNKRGVVTFKRPGKVTITVTAKRGKKKARVRFVVGK